MGQFLFLLQSVGNNGSEASIMQYYSLKRKMNERNGDDFASALLYSRRRPIGTPHSTLMFSYKATKKLLFQKQVKKGRSLFLLC